MTLVVSEQSLGRFGRRWSVLEHEEHRAHFYLTAFVDPLNSKIRDLPDSARRWNLSVDFRMAKPLYSVLHDLPLLEKERNLAPRVGLLRTRWSPVIAVLSE